MSLASIEFFVMNKVLKLSELILLGPTVNCL